MDFKRYFADIDAIRARALRSILQPDYEYNLRHIFRWYSRSFATPLHHVPNLPLEDVLQAFFEERYETMEAQNQDPLIREELDDLVMTPTERAEKEKLVQQYEEADDEWLAQIEADLAEGKAVGKKKKPPPPVDPDVKISFVNTDLLAQLADLDPLAPPKKK